MNGERGGLKPPRFGIFPRRINSRLSNARNPPPRISETHPSPTREGGFCVFGRRGFNRRRAKNQRWIWIVAPRQAYPPANQFAAIKCAKSASADFKNARIPNPRRRVLRVWQARFQPPARKKSSMEMDWCVPPLTDHTHFYPDYISFWRFQRLWGIIMDGVIAKIISLVVSLL